jgi:hypothetical protein
LGSTLDYTVVEKIGGSVKKQKPIPNKEPGFFIPKLAPTSNQIPFLILN